MPTSFKRIFASAYDALQHHKATCDTCQQALREQERGCPAGVELWRSAIDEEWQKLNIKVIVKRT